MVALEHTLIILLVLVALLQTRPQLPSVARWAAAGALALALVVPGLPLSLPWGWLSAIVIPVLLWQAARLLVGARWPGDLRDVLLWALSAAGIGAVLMMVSSLPATGAVLFGLLAASAAWGAAEEEPSASALGVLGTLALIILLVEIAPAVEAPGRYGLALAGGAALGAAIGFVGVRLALRTPRGWARDALSIGQVYLAYAAAWLLGLSSVAAAMFAVLSYVAYGTRSRLWPDGVIRPQPLKARPLYGLALLALAFFAWQTHVPLTPALALELALGLVVIGMLVLAARALRSRAFPAERSAPQWMLRLAALLVPAILLWPREALLDPAPLALALLAAAAVTLVAHLALTPLLNLYAWLDESGASTDRPGRALTGVHVSQLMSREVAQVPPETPIPELARALLESATGCVLIVEPDGRLAGIVTESDLFLRTERIPRSGRTYAALFKEPVEPERLPEVYARLGAEHKSAEVMNPKVIWIRPTQSLPAAIRLMAQHGLRRLPVVDDHPGQGGRVVGVLTRADIIRWLTHAGQPPLPAQPCGPGLG